MTARCDQGILLYLSLGLSIISIMSYIDNQSLREQLYLCQSRRRHCKENQLIIIKNILTDLIDLQTFISKNKQLDFLKLEHYLNSLAPSLRPQVSRDVGMATYSCPETFKLVGRPYTHGFKRENCSRPSIYESTSLILLHPVRRDNLLVDMMENMFRLFHHIIVIHDEESSGIIEKLSSKAIGNRIDTIVIPSRSGYSIGDALNSAVDLIKSPFVLVAPYIGRLDTTLDIERLIHVQETTKAAVVGGAVKDIKTGGWDRSCYQIELKLNTLRYITGYYLSQHECLYCDFIVSPFLVRTEMLQKYKFSKLNHGVLEDLFLRLKHDGEKVLSCPDVMFYVDKQELNANQLRDFAERRNIRTIKKSDGSVLWFGYKAESAKSKKIDFSVLGKYKPTHACGASPSLAVSPDCRHNLLDVIWFILDLCENNNIHCTLEEGTLLGAVKFNHILPWERDADISFFPRDFHKLKGMESEFKKRGFLMKVDKESELKNGVYVGGIVYIKAYGWHIEMYGFSKFMRKTKPYTKVKFGSRWANGPENPGLYARNRYGREIYRHAEHWRANNAKHGFVDYVTGKFPECTRPGDNSCLDQFHADGDLQFRDYL